MTKIANSETVKFQPETLVTPSAGVSKSVAIPLSPENLSNNDSLNINSSNSTNNSGANVRTERNLLDTFIPLYNSFELGKYGVSQADFSNINTIETLTGKSVEELLNAEDAEITKLYNDVKQAITDLIEDTHGLKDIKIDVIRNYVRMNNGQVPAGWDSVDSFRKAQSRVREDGTSNAHSLSDRLNLMYGCGDLNKLSEEELAYYLEEYFDGYFNKINESGKSRKDVDNLQLTDFSKLLVNSEREELEAFRKALQYLVVNNRAEGYEAILKNFDTAAERLDFIKKAPDDFVEKIMTTPDQRGEVAETEQTAKFVAVHTRYMDKETLDDYQEKSVSDASNFYNEENLSILDEIEKNPEIIQNIQEKLVLIEKIQDIKRRLNNNEQVSEEEKALLENPVELTELEQTYLNVYAKDRFYKGDNAGQIIGASTNEILSEEDKESCIKTANYNAFAISKKVGKAFYRAVLKGIKSYTNSLSGQEKDAFVDLMTRTIGENYTKALNDDFSSLVEPSQPPTDASTSTSEHSATLIDDCAMLGTLGYDINSDIYSDINVSLIQSSISQLYMTNSIEQSSGEVLPQILIQEESVPNHFDINVAAKFTVEKVRDYAKKTNTNITEVALKVLDLNNAKQAILSWAFEKFDALNNSQKVKACNNMKNNGNKITAGNLITSVEALEEVDCHNSLVKKRYQEHINELKEKQA